MVCVSVSVIIAECVELSGGCVDVCVSHRTECVKQGGEPERKFVWLSGRVVCVRLSSSL